MTDSELTARVRGVIAAGPASDSLLVTQPGGGEVVVQARASCNYVVVLTPHVRKVVESALREWMPDLRRVRFDPHH